MVNKLKTLYTHVFVDETKFTIFLEDIVMIKTRIINDEYIFEIFLDSNQLIQLVCINKDRMNDLHDYFCGEMEKLNTINKDYL